MFEASVFMQCYITHQLPDSFTSVFKYNWEVQDTRLTRQSSMLYTKRCDSNFAKQFPMFAFPRIWNNLNANLSTITSKLQFKRTFKSHILSSYVSIVCCTNPHCSDCRK